MQGSERRNEFLYVLTDQVIYFVANDQKLSMNVVITHFRTK